MKTWQEVNNLLIEKQPLVYVYYHKNCMDGFAAALVAKHNIPFVDEFIPVTYGSEPRSHEDAIIFILDFSFPKKQLDKLAENNTLVVLDHHKTAEFDLKDTPYSLFDMSESGASLTLKYFDSAVTLNLKTLVKYVKDRDLWLWKEMSSREFSAGLASYPMDFNIWDSLVPNQLIHEGSTILRFQEQMVQRILSSATEHVGKLFEMDVPEYVSVNTGSLQSEVGEALLAKYPEAKFAVMWYANGTKYIYSLRSRKDFDCSVVARMFGGGGHAQACGFTK